MQKLVQALAAFHADVGRITKQSKAQYGNYADLATVLTTVTPALASNGLVVSQTFSPWDGNGTILRTTLAHISGESIVSELMMPSTEGQRNVLHAFGAATTYLRRYALLAILNLAAEDDDGESFARETSKTTARSTSANKTITKVAAPQPQAAALPNPEPTELTREEKSELVALVTRLPADVRDNLVAAFRSEYGLQPDVRVAEYIKTVAHAVFIQQFVGAATAAA